MTGKGPSWRHHYVPQFYLRKWLTEDGDLFEYRRVPHRGVVEERRRHTKATGFVPHLYALETESASSFAPDLLERRLQRIEDSAAAALDRLLSKGVSCLTEADRRTWSDYMYLQLDRDPERLTALKQVADEARMETLAGLPPEIANSKAAELFSEAMARNMGRGLLVTSHESRSRWIESQLLWDWTIVKRTGTFITSDRPVLLDFGPGVPGQAAYCVTMALSPHQLLFCMPRRSFDIPEGWFAEMAWAFNAVLIRRGPRFVYSALPLNSLPTRALKGLLDKHLRESDDLPTGSK